MAEFCSECGERATGKFCSACGTPLQAPPAADFPWRESCDFPRICQVADVHMRIEQARLAAGSKVSSSQMLKLIDNMVAPLMGGLSSLALAKVAQPVTARLGLRTYKDRRELLPLPPGEVLANLAVTFARDGNTILRSEPHADSCTVEALTPADLRAMEGRLRITVERAPRGTWFTAQATIDGQWYDWGKCSARLEQLLESLRTAA